MTDIASTSVICKETAMAKGRRGSSGKRSRPSSQSRSPSPSSSGRKSRHGTSDKRAKSAFAQYSTGKEPSDVVDLTGDDETDELTVKKRPKKRLRNEKGTGGEASPDESPGKLYVLSKSTRTSSSESAKGPTRRERSSKRGRGVEPQPQSAEGSQRGGCSRGEGGRVDLTSAEEDSTRRNKSRSRRGSRDRSKHSEDQSPRVRHEKGRHGDRHSALAQSSSPQERGGSTEGCQRKRFHGDGGEEWRSGSRQDDWNKHSRRADVEEDSRGHSYDVETARGVRLFQLLDERVAVVLSHPATVSMRGRASLQCMCGSVDILGHYVTASDTWHPVFSPVSHSAITIATRAGDVGDDASHSPLRGSFASSDEENNFMVARGACDRPVVLVLKKLWSESCDLAACLLPYRKLFESHGDTGNGLGAQLYAQHASPAGGALRMSEEYTRVAGVLSNLLQQGETPVVAVCGGKNVGKSTMTRYLMNTALNCRESVAYLECDLGQPEFTLPGCLSLSLVREPLLGPSFTHQRETLRTCFVGALSPSDNPTHYLHCLKYVFEEFKRLTPRPPLLVNTMGWNKGLGLSLLRDTFRLVGVDVTVQIHSSNKSKNMADITPMFVHGRPGWLSPQLDSGGERAACRPHRLEPVLSLVDPRHESEHRYKPPDHRCLTVLAYLGQALGQGRGQATPGQATPGKATPGQATPGKVTPGQATPGKATPAQTTPGKATPGQATPGQATPGKATPGQATPERRASLSLFAALAPRVVPWDAVAVHVCNGAVPNSHVMYALNGSLVALCAVPEEKMVTSNEPDCPKFLSQNPICPCLGFGVIRAIDPDDKVFHIVTPMTSDDLSKVNCLLKGVQDIPPEMILTMGYSSSKPYVGNPKNVTGATSIKGRRHLLRQWTPAGGATAALTH